MSVVKSRPSSQAPGPVLYGCRRAADLHPDLTMLAQAAQQRVPATSQHSVMLGSLANMHVLLLAQGRAMKILIGTPTYGESVTTTYFDSVMWMLQHFQAKHPHIRFEHRFQPCGMLAMVRNYFASRVLNDESFTHLLFIDSDMASAQP